MTIITARAALRGLEIRRQQSELSAAAELDEPTRRAIVAALASVRPNSRVDLRLLIEAAKREVADCAAADLAERERNADRLAFEYAVSIRSPDELRRMRDDLLTRIQRGEGAQPFRFDIEPAVALEGATDAIAEGRLARSSRVPRVRSRRALMEASAAAVAVPAPTTAKKRSQRAPGRAFGPQAESARPMGAPVGADYGRWRNPARPPWLLDDQPDAATHP